MFDKIVNMPRSLKSLKFAFFAFIFILMTTIAYHFVICMFTSSRSEVFCKKGIFNFFLQNSQENTCARVSFLTKLPGLLTFILKETLAQLFSCEFCKIFENIFSYRNPLVAVSACFITLFFKKFIIVCLH